MRSNLFFNSYQKAEDETHDIIQDGEDAVINYYNQLKFLYNNKQQLTFDDNKYTVKIKPTTWRLVINLS